MDRIYTLPEGWSYKELKEIADVITGVSFKPDDITKDGIRILRSGNIQNGYVQTKIDDVFLNDSYFNKQNTIQYLDNCITSSTGSVDVLGKCGTVFDVFEKTQIGAFLRLVRSKDIDNALYISLILHSPLYFQYIRQFAKNGTSINNIKNEHLEDFKFPFPPKDLKERISRFYLSLEKKILLNTHINAELETMAKQLYDYWFVQFDFPDENGKPYKSSGGKMVYNETLKREIPEGWEDSILSEIANITMGQSPDGSSYNEEGNGTVFYQGSTDFGIRFPSIRMYTTEPSRFATKGDILMSVRAPVGDTNIANTDCCIGRGLAALNSKIGSITYLYFILDYLKAKFDLLNSVGTTFGAITKDELFTLPVIKPDNDVLKCFENICSPIFNKQMNIGFEINELTHLRDSLLPMLMNGQVTVE